MDKVRVGIIGSKFAASFHADCYRRIHSAEVVAVAADPAGQPEKFAKDWGIPHAYTEVKEMLKRDDLQMISVCVPNFLHPQMVIAAAEAGKHVVCEKPLATKAEDGRQMIAACEKAGVKLMYAEDWVFCPSLVRAQKVIAEGAIGRVLYVKGKECHNGTHSPFAKKKETCGGGSLMHLGVHPVVYFLHLLGEEGKNPVVEVTGFANRGSQDNYVHKDNTGEDFGAGMLLFRNGARAFVEGNYITVGGMDDKVEIYGTDGLIKVDLTHSSNVQVYSRPGYSYCIEKADNCVGWTRPAVDEFFGLGYVPELTYFLECVLHNRQPIYGCSGRAGLAGLEIVQAMYRSAEEGKTVQGEWGGAVGIR